MGLNFLLNQEALILFVGGLFPLFLTVVIHFGKQEFKRNQERDRLEILKRERPEEIGDVNEKLNNSPKYKRLNFFQELSILGLQPLMIIVFLNLLDNKLDLTDLFIIGLLLMFMLTHELWAADRFSNKWIYQLSLLLVWILIYLYVSYNNSLEVILN